MVLGRQQPQSFLTGRGDPNVEPGMSQTTCNRGPYVRVVVDHEDGAACALLRGLLPCPHRYLGAGQICTGAAATLEIDQRLADALQV